MRRPAVRRKSSAALMLLSTMFAMAEATSPIIAWWVKVKKNRFMTIPAMNSATRS